MGLPLTLIATEIGLVSINTGAWFGSAANLTTTESNVCKLGSPLMPPYSTTYPAMLVLSFEKSFQSPSV